MGGGGGKSWAILVDNLQGVHDPDYFSVFFRNSTTEIDKGLWPEAKKMYEPLLLNVKGKYKGKAHINEQTKTITFPSGARTSFSYLEYDKHADAWYGSELCKIYFDEFQKISKYAFDVLRSRNRSRAKVLKGIRCTLNPDNTHHCYEWILPFLDEEGYPIKEYSAKTRYFVIVNDVLYTDWDKEKLKEKFPNKNPLTYTYIPATLSDNEYLEKLDPEYRDNLDSLPEEKRKQMLLGCWADTGDKGIFFKREWLPVCNTPPSNLTMCRAWDKAASEPTATYKPDYTASIKLGKCRYGNYYIFGDYALTNKDPNTETYGRFRKNAGERDQLIQDQAEIDGKDCTVIFPVDIGQAGKTEFQESSKKLFQEGFVVKSDPTPNNKKKVIKYQPVSSACQIGLVYLVENSFINKETLDGFLTENERFTGGRSSNQRHDDWADCFATAFNYLCKERVIKIVPRNQNNDPTLAKTVLTNMNN